MRFLHSASLSALALLLTASLSAHANTISGSAFCGVSSADASATPAPGAPVSGTLCATFQSSAINFDGNGGNTLGSFLNSGKTILGPINYLNGFGAASNLDYSVFEFTGTAFFVNGVTYSATHDDGTVMTVNGVTVINSGQPTSPATNTFVFSGVTGNYNFAYDYSEVQGGSIYKTDATNSPVPEPSSLMLMGTGILSAAGAIRRRVTRA